ncbi:protein FAM200C-like [Oratosquilla oratoria]|uniref:protein FAM200C-like n=1 Tax=Oratosquilla oratoria TaxID=337810 RepID=UPI003F75A6FA
MSGELEMLAETTSCRCGHILSRKVPGVPNRWVVKPWQGGRVALLEVDEFLYCSALETITKADDVMEKVSTFFLDEGLQWENVWGVCTNGAPAMLGSKSGFQSRVKKLAPQAKGIHCMIHRYALASKTLPASLQEVLKSVIKTVNYVKTQALNTRLFKELCKDMNADHEVLLFYTAVRWL